MLMTRNLVMNGVDNRRLSTPPPQPPWQQPLTRRERGSDAAGADATGADDDDDAALGPEDENGNEEKAGAHLVWPEQQRRSGGGQHDAGKYLHSQMPSSTTATTTMTTISSSSSSLEPTTNEVVHENLLFSAQRKKSNHDGYERNSVDKEEEEEEVRDKEEDDDDDEGEKKNEDAKSDKSLAGLQIHFVGKESDSSNRSFAGEEEEDEEEAEEEEEVAMAEAEEDSRGREMEDDEEEEEGGSSRRVSDSDEELCSSSRKMARMDSEETAMPAALPRPWNLKFGSPLIGVSALSTLGGSCSVNQTPGTSEDEMEDEDTAFDRRYKVSLKHDYLDSSSSATAAAAAAHYAATSGGGLHPAAGSGRRKQKNPVRFDARHDADASGAAAAAAATSFAAAGESRSLEDDDVDGLAAFRRSASPSSSSFYVPRSETPASDSSLLPYPSRSSHIAAAAASAPTSPFSVNDDSRSNSVFAHNNAYHHHQPPPHRGHHRRGEGEGRDALDFRRLEGDGRESSSRSPTFPEAPLDLTVHKRSASASSPMPGPSSSGHPAVRRAHSSASPPRKEARGDIPPPLSANSLLSPFGHHPNVFAPPLPPPSSSARHSPSDSNPLPALPLPPSNVEEQLSRQMFQEKLRQDLLQAKLRTVAHQQQQQHQKDNNNHVVGPLAVSPHLPPFMQNPSALMPLLPPPLPPPPLPGGPPLPPASFSTQVEPLPSFSAPSPDEFFIDGLPEFDVGGEHFKCPYCEIVFTYKTSLYRHIKSFHQIGEVYACDKCGYVSPRKDKFKSHLVVHEREGRVQKHSNNVRHRIKADPLEESYNCLCGYRTWVKSAYDKHVQQHNMGENMAEVPLSCKICGENFKGETELENHMRTHKENSHYLCDICGFASVQMKKVIEHRRTHTGEKPFECKVCSYRCARRDNLMLHYRKRHKTEAVLPRIRQRVRHKTSDAGAASSTSATTSIPAITFPPSQPPPPPQPPPPLGLLGEASSSKPTSLQSLLLNAGQPSPNKLSAAVSDRSFRPSLLKSAPTPPPLVPLFNPPLHHGPPHGPSRMLPAAAAVPPEMSSAHSQDLSSLPSPFSSLPFPLGGFPAGLPPPALAMGKSKDRRGEAEDARPRGASSPKSSLDPSPSSSSLPAPAFPPGLEAWQAMASIDMNLLSVIQRFSHDEKRLRAIMEAHFNHSQRQFPAHLTTNEAAAALPPPAMMVPGDHAAAVAPHHGEGVVEGMEREGDHGGAAASTSSLSSNVSSLKDDAVASVLRDKELESARKGVAISSSGYSTPSSLPAFPPSLPPPHQYSLDHPAEPVGAQTSPFMNALGDAAAAAAATAADPTSEAVRRLLQASQLKLQQQQQQQPPAKFASLASGAAPTLPAPFFSAQGLATVPHYRPPPSSSSATATTSSTSIHDNNSKQCSINQKGILSASSPSGEEDRHASTPSPNRLTIVEPPPPPPASFSLASLFSGGGPAASMPTVPHPNSAPLYHHGNKLARQLLTNPPPTSAFTLPTTLSSATDGAASSSSAAASAAAKMAQYPDAPNPTFHLSKEAVSENN